MDTVASANDSFVTVETTLGELVTQRPDLARNLERWGLDYCCGGRRSLADACERAGVDVHAVVAELAAKGGAAPADWAGFSPAELATHIEETHHAYLHAELPRLGQLADKVRRVHGDRHPELAEVQAVYEALHADMVPHLAREEEVVFPLVRKLGAAPASPGSDELLRARIATLVAEHDDAGDMLEKLRTLTSDYTPPADGCASYQALYQGLAELESDLHLHVHKENNVLFPAVAGTALA